MCTGGRMDCGGTCVDTTMNDTHCGECDTPCTGARTCVASDCVCTGGLTDCGGACVDTDTSEAHCGDCDDPCEDGETCVDGTCMGATSPIFVGTLAPTNGVWNYMSMLGVPGADAACDALVAGSAHCTSTQLTAAAAQGDFVGASATSLWWDDPSLDDELRCGSATGLTPWTYGSAHLGCEGRSVTVNGTTGALGAPAVAACGSSRPVACCM